MCLRAAQGGARPTTGFQMAVVMLQLCDRVALYGFGPSAQGQQKAAYHFFQVRSEPPAPNPLMPCLGRRVRSSARVRASSVASSGIRAQDMGHDVGQGPQLRGGEPFLAIPRRER